MPKYSIIVPTMHRTDLLSKCVDSIARHSADYQLQVIQGQHFDDALEIGVNRADCETIILLHDDTEVQTPDWLPLLESAMTPRTAFIVPRQPWASPTDGIQVLEPKLSLSAWSIGYFPAALFCFMFRKSWFMDFGGQDRAFDPFGGYGTDEDWMARIYLARWTVTMQPSVHVEHLHMGTIGTPPNKGELQAGACQFLKQRYAGRIPK